MRYSGASWLCLLVATVCLLLSSEASADDAWSEPHPGIKVLRRALGNRVFHAAVVDLTRPEVSLRVTKFAERNRTTSSFAALTGAVIAVNGDFITANGGSLDYDKPVGLCVGDGELWTTTADQGGYSFTACDAVNHCHIDPPGAETAWDPTWRNVLGGREYLVYNGEVNPGCYPGGEDFCNGDHQRTSIGLSAEGKKLILGAAEGRHSPIVGPSLIEMGSFMKEMGAHTALNQDGGGSTSFVVEGVRVSALGAGASERSVSNHFGVLYQAPIPAQLTGNEALALVNWPSWNAWPKDGHPEVFARKASGDLVHLYATAGDSWTEPEVLATGAGCGLASVYWPTTYYPEIFSPRPKDTALHLWFDSTAGAWTTFQDFGGAGFAKLVSLAWKDGHAEVFALGPDQAIWHRYWSLPVPASTDNWSAWTSLGGKFETGPSAILWADGHGEVFATDADGVPWHNWYSTAFADNWSGWQQLTGSLSSRPVPVRWPEGPVELFARGVDGRLQHSTFAGGAWTAFEPLSGETLIAGEPSAAMSPTGPVVVAQGLDGSVVALTWEGSAYSKLKSLGEQKTQSDPFVWARADSTLEVFAIDAKGSLLQACRGANGVWGKWTSLGEGFDPCKSPIAVSDGGAAGPEAAVPTDAGAKKEAGKDSGNDTGPASPREREAPGADAGLSKDAGSPGLAPQAEGCACRASGQRLPSSGYCGLLVALLCASLRLRRSGHSTIVE